MALRLKPQRGQEAERWESELRRVPQMPQNKKSRACQKLRRAGAGAEPTRSGGGSFVTKRTRTWRDTSASMAVAPVGCSRKSPSAAREQRLLLAEEHGAVEGSSPPPVCWRLVGCEARQCVPSGGERIEKVDRGRRRRKKKKRKREGIGVRARVW